MARERNEALWTTWRERIDRFSQSGLTVDAFCLQEGISVPSYYQWKRRISCSTITGTEPRPASTTFIPIQIGSLSSIEVHLACGARIVVPSHARDAIRTVIEALTGDRAENRSC